MVEKYLDRQISRRKFLAGSAVVSFAAGAMACGIGKAESPSPLHINVPGPGATFPNTEIPTSTLTPEPTPTVESTPTIEAAPSQEAVLDLGDFDFAVLRWEELNIEPNKIYLAGGVSQDIKTVVVGGIVRNKTNKMYAFDDSNVGQATAASTMLFVNSSGEQLTYKNGLAPVSFSKVAPYKYGGIFKDAYMTSANGTILEISSFHQQPDFTEKTYYSDLKMPPGCGMPVFMLAHVPKDVSDYGIGCDTKINGKDVLKIVKKGSVAKNYALVDEGSIPLLPLADTISFPDPIGGSLDFGYGGSSWSVDSGSGIPVFAININLANKTNRLIGEGLPEVRSLYLSDGRVIPLVRHYDVNGPKIPPGSSRSILVYAGSYDINADFQDVNKQVLTNLLKFETAGATIVMASEDMISHQMYWGAWKLPGQPQPTPTWERIPYAPANH